MDRIFLHRRRIIEAFGDVDGTKIQWDQLSEGMVQIVEKDRGGYIRQIQIGGQIYSGEDFRCRLWAAFGLFRLCD